jgi:hypothetical protein
MLVYGSACVFVCLRVCAHSFVHEQACACACLRACVRAVSVRARDVLRVCAQRQCVRFIGCGRMPFAHISETCGPGRVASEVRVWSIRVSPEAAPPTLPACTQLLCMIRALENTHAYTCMQTYPHIQDYIMPVAENVRTRK